MFGETVAEQRLQVFKIIRDGQHRFFGLTPLDTDVSGYKAGGRFSKFVPNPPPTEADRMVATHLLESRGWHFPTRTQS